MTSNEPQFIHRHFLSEIVQALDYPCSIIDSNFNTLYKNNKFKSLQSVYNIGSDEEFKNSIKTETLNQIRQFSGQNSAELNISIILDFPSNKQSEPIKIRSSVKSIKTSLDENIYFLVQLGSKVEAPTRKSNQDQLNMDLIVMFLNSMKLNACLLNQDGVIIYINKQFANLLSYEKTEIEGKKTLAHLSDPSDADTYEDKILSVLFRISNSENFQKKYLKKDGNKIWLEQDLSYFTSISGKPIFISLFCDLTLVKRLQKEIIVNKSQLDSIFQMDFGNLVLCDENKTIINANVNFASILGYHPNEIIGLNPDDLKFPEDKIKPCEMDYVKNPNKPYLNKRYQHKNGKEVWLSMRGDKFETQKKDVYYLVHAIEVTEFIKDKEKAQQLFSFQRELTTQSLALDQKNILIKKIKTFLEKRVESSDNNEKAAITKLMNMINSDVENNSNWSAFKYVYSQIHPRFLSKLDKIHPILTKNEQRHCVFIKIKLAKKEIATLLNVRATTIDIARYRIKKKLNLHRDTKLESYISSL